MEKKRNKLEVIRDILLVIQSKNGRIKPTQILYKSNLSHSMMKEYLGSLIQQGLIKESISKSGRTYSLTEKGSNYLSEYKKISSFMESFGLSENE